MQRQGITTMMGGEDDQHHYHHHHHHHHHPHHPHLQLLELLLAKAGSSDGLLPSKHALKLRIKLLLGAETI
jgi:hypothetical protein